MGTMGTGELQHQKDADMEDNVQSMRQEVAEAGLPVPADEKGLRLAHGELLAVVAKRQRRHP